MKRLIFFAAICTLCASSAIPVDYEAIPTIPGDNSHYVEGESRYIWMPDGEGIPQLVDLQAPVDEDFLRNRVTSDINEYWLYTRNNPLDAQVIVYGNETTITESNYDGSLPLSVIVHGWNNNGNSDMNPLITAAFLAVMDCNVIVVDWSELASNINYITASNGVPAVGDYLGEFLMWLIETAGGDWNSVHLAGHSLGAHVVGNAGRKVGGIAARVTGMDPAGPLWGGNANALNTSSGLYVEAIHTDGGVLGIWEPIAHVDFYPNGGSNPQPGCWISTCSHGRSHDLFASTVQYNELVGYQCANITETQDVSCSGDTLNMGNSILTKTGLGIYGLETTSSWPYYTTTRESKKDIRL